MKWQRFSTVVLEESDLNISLSGKDTKAQPKLHHGSQANMLQMRHAKLQSSTEHIPQSQAPHNFVDFVLFYLFLSFFQTLYSPKQTKTPFHFIQHKNIFKFYITFLVFATPESLPPAIPSQALLATLAPISSGGDLKEGYYLLIQGLQVQTQFESVFDVGQEDP